MSVHGDVLPSSPAYRTPYRVPSGNVEEPAVAGRRGAWEAARAEPGTVRAAVAAKSPASHQELEQGRLTRQ